MQSRRWLSTPRLILAVSLVSAAACGPFRRGNPEDEALIYFSNSSTEQAAVYAVGSSGEQQRIGTVSSGRTDTLKVPESIVARGAVNIVVRLLARSETPSSGSFSVGPGTRHEVRLTSDGRALMVLPGS